MPIPLSSGSMEAAEAMVFFGVHGRASGGPQLKFAVVKLERLREAPAMVRLLREYHSTGEIHVANLHQVERASRLDGILVEMKDALLEIFHPAPGSDGGELEKNLDLGEEPEKPPSKIRLGGDCVQACWEEDAFSLAVAELGLDDLRAEESRPVVPRSGVEEKIRESLRRGEAEQLGMNSVKALADSLVSPDVRGVVSLDVISEIQSSVDTVLYGLRSLQDEVIPSTLMEIKKGRNQSRILTQPHS